MRVLLVLWNFCILSNLIVINEIENVDVCIYVLAEPVSIPFTWTVFEEFAVPED